MNYLHTCMHALRVSATAGGTAATLGMGKGKGLPLQIVLNVLSNDRFGALVAGFDVALTYSPGFWEETQTLVSICFISSLISL
jgi:hypothetical protein